MQFAVQGIRGLKSDTIYLEATDAREAHHKAEAHGLSVIAVRAQRSAFRLGTRSSFPLVQFSQSLLTLLSAGLSLVESLEALEERETRAEVKQTLKGLLQRLYEGQSFSSALEDHPAAFPNLYTASIRANERTGGLPQAIERFLFYRAQVDLVKKRVISASIYPALIVLVGGLVVLFLLLYVVPRFAQIFDELGSQIPYASRLLLEWGKFVHAHGFLVLGATAALPLGLLYASAQPGIRASVARLVSRLPRVGDYFRIYELARCYRALGMLLRGGIPIVPALDMVTGLLGAGVRPGLAGARRDIGEGQAVSVAFERHGLSTPVALRMLRVGERTGSLGEMLERIAAFYDGELTEAIDWFIRLFEPLLMVVIGAVIGAIVLLMYAPIFELAGSIQ